MGGGDGGAGCGDAAGFERDARRGVRLGRRRIRRLSSCVVARGRALWRVSQLRGEKRGRSGGTGRRPSARAARRSRARRGEGTRLACFGLYCSAEESSGGGLSLSAALATARDPLPRLRQEQHEERDHRRHNVHASRRDGERRASAEVEAAATAAPPSPQGAGTRRAVGSPPLTGCSLRAGRRRYPPRLLSSYSSTTGRGASASRFAGERRRRGDGWARPGQLEGERGGRRSPRPLRRCLWSTARSQPS